MGPIHGNGRKGAEITICFAHLIGAVWVFEGSESDLGGLAGTYAAAGYTVLFRKKEPWSPYSGGGGHKRQKSEPQKKDEMAVADLRIP